MIEEIESFFELLFAGSLLLDSNLLLLHCLQ